MSEVMKSRELLLLSPYRLPGKDALMLGNEDVAAFLNAYLVLWHPAALWYAAAPPRVGSPYDYEQPSPGHVYALPDSPPLFLPDEWDERVRTAGACAFKATPDRDTTLDNLRTALAALPPGDEQPPGDLWSIDPTPFYGLGLGYVVLETLFEAMEHENLLATTELLENTRQAITALLQGNAEAGQGFLVAAADRLLSAREVLYPVTIHLLDLLLLDERTPFLDWPATLNQELPSNILASARILENLQKTNPEAFERLRQRVDADQAEVCGGDYLEREDATLPMASQLWNLLKGLAVQKSLVGREPRVFARKRFAAHPHLPGLLNAVGIRRAVHVAFDEAVVPGYRSTVISWSTADGKSLEAFTRVPYQADNPQTWFHLAHYLQRTIMQDQAATLAFLHRGTPPPPWYHDLIALSKLRPVLGQWTTLSRYFDEVLAGEYINTALADEFHGDYLGERVEAQDPTPIGGLVQRLRLRRRIDTAWTLAGIYRSLVGSNDNSGLSERIAAVEDQVETIGSEVPDLPHVEQEAIALLAQRLTARAPTDTPGYLVLNPCTFARRVALELDGFHQAPATEGPIKAAQLDGTLARVVVEVPALGFAWFPSQGVPAAPPSAARMRLADNKALRNEFFEAELDPATGGLRGIHDHRTRISRVGQQLVYNPGSTMKVRDVRVTSTGPALGEVITEGVLVDDQDQELASWRQRYRAWLGRPVLDLRIELTPKHVPVGYPWHSYYGARFAWRDERAILLRGVQGIAYTTSHTRPEAPDFLELRSGRLSTTLLMGGLPFHQRHGSRMLDTILIPPGETTTVFDLAIALDREQPMQTALGLVTPVPYIATTKGPPHIGPTGWLFHLDASNLLLSSLRPDGAGTDAVIAHLQECKLHHTQAEFRCPRNPQRALFQDATGTMLLDVATQGDGVVFEMPQGDLAHLRMEFS